MLAARSTKTIKAPTGATFSAVESDVSLMGDFGVVLYVQSGVTATFTIEGCTTLEGVEIWTDISGGATLSGLTSSARLDFPRGDFTGQKIRVACTSYSGTGNVGAALDSVE